MPPDFDTRGAGAEWRAMVLDRLGELNGKLDSLGKDLRRDLTSVQLSQAINATLPARVSQHEDRIAALERGKAYFIGIAATAGFLVHLLWDWLRNKL